MSASFFSSGALLRSRRFSSIIRISSSVHSIPDPPSRWARLVDVPEPIGAPFCYCFGDLDDALVDRFADDMFARAALAGGDVIHRAFISSSLSSSFLPLGVLVFFDLMT